LEKKVKNLGDRTGNVRIALQITNMKTNTEQSQDTKRYDRTMKITDEEDVDWKCLAYFSLSNVNSYHCITEY
jgi:hypothetical protein